MKLMVQKWLSSFFKSVLSQKNIERNFRLERRKKRKFKKKQKHKELEE